MFQDKLKIWIEGVGREKYPRLSRLQFNALVDFAYWLDRAAELPLEPTAPIPAAAKPATLVQCPKCGYWVNLYDGGKMVLHKDHSRPNNPYCQLSNTEYRPLP